MKNHTSLLELVIITSLLVAAVPLLVQLVTVCNKSTYDFLDDKTLVNKSSYIEYEIVDDGSGRDLYVPKDMRGISMDLGDTFIIPLIQDDYCPNEGRKVFYDLGTTDKTLDAKSNSFITRRDYIFEPSSSENISNYLNITNGWKSRKIDETSRIFNNTMFVVDDGTKLKTSKDIQVSPVYLVWNYKANCWVLTYNNILIEN